MTVCSVYIVNTVNLSCYPEDSTTMSCVYVDKLKTVLLQNNTFCHDHIYITTSCHLTSKRVWWDKLSRNVSHLHWLLSTPGDEELWKLVSASTIDITVNTYSKCAYDTFLTHAHHTFTKNQQQTQKNDQTQHRQQKYQQQWRHSFQKMGDQLRASTFP